ncbi:AMP-binding protein [uncultured Mycolicibacterium sp.]|uniref:AMP-binding protein n=1 Tax=uncultured Mycolicibacterium sp. TaxID=2320817 RepID=UPI00260679DB|nr:AMP-binding protein [uncultured Mycolicibacterium sp.]
MTTLADALRTAAERTPDRVLVIDAGVRLDAATLQRKAAVLAQALGERMPPGSVVSFMLPNWHEAAVIYLAATLAGMVVNPILPSLRDRELGFILDDAAVRMLFVPAEFGGHDYVAMARRVTGRLAAPPEVVVLRGEPGPFRALRDLVPADTRPTPQRLDPDAPRMILYTSGTTGRPKAVLHSDATIAALIGQIGAHWRVEPGDTFLVPSPIAHIGGSIYAFECPLLLGSTAVLMSRWDPDTAVALMLEHRCTHMAGATPFLEHLLAAARRAGTRLPDLKVFICGGASVPPALIRSATDYFERAAVSRVYGSTEVPVTTVGALDDPDAAADTDGRPGIARVRIAPHPAAPAGTGEIEVRGPQRMLRYARDEDTAAAITDDGWFRTGDLGRFNDDGYLVVTGRAKDIIIRHGENISPKEVEDVLAGHPDIAEVAVVGLPDPRTGERACAVIVPAAGRPGPDLAELRRYLAAAGVARFKTPEQVEIWQALPKSDAGKVLKHRIRAALLGDGIEDGGLCR